MPLASNLKKFSFPYGNLGCRTPRIPIRFEDSEGKQTPIINALLDSGSDFLVMREDLANEMGIALQEQETSASTAGGAKKLYKGLLPALILGRGGRDVRWENIDVYVIEDNTAFLVGIDPVFYEYNVEIQAYHHKVKLTPK